MGNDLDLYGRGSGPRTHIGWRGVIAGGVVATLLLGVGGYRWMTNSTPVSQDQALDIFRAQTRESATVARQDRGAEVAPKEIDKGSSVPTNGRPAAVEAPRRSQRSAVVGSRRSQSTEAPKDRTVAVEDRSPDEGVYSWDTDGWEEAGGARRTMPEESQRIITHHDSGWKQHHYFSAQREIWTTFESTARGAEISYQRNKVVFGPITNDSFIDFAPPMLVGPRALEVGQTWDGSWEGKTYGTYEGRTFERVVLDIGGTKVEAFGVQVDIHLQGEQRGDVTAQVWIAPEYGMTVKEHFVQSVRASVGTYNAEWTITLKSLEPRR